MFALTAASATNLFIGDCAAEFESSTNRSLSAAAFDQL
jgi:hypothetical protein